jgi:hypothetical protein
LRPRKPAHGGTANVARGTRKKERAMNEDAFNVSIRKFLKTLGVTGQREIEKAVRAALERGQLKGTARFPARATISIPAVGLTHEITGDIEIA